MKRQDIILNSIVFKEALDKGIHQADLVARVADLGVRGLEIRREFLQDPKTDLAKIVAAGKRYNLPLFYSVNEDFLRDAQVNPDLPQLREEAELLGSPFVKLNTGDSRGVSVEQVAVLADQLAQGPQVLLENNQTPGHASLANCQATMALVKAASLPIGFVFDTANWVFVGEDPYQARAALQEVTTYLHCKNYQVLEGQPQVSPSFYQGRLDLLDLIAPFDQATYFALEYPSTLEQLEADLLALEKV